MDSIHQDKVKSGHLQYKIALVHTWAPGCAGCAGPPLKTQNRASPPPKRSAHPSRVRRGCFDPPSPKIEAVGCANPYPPSKNFEPSKKIFHSGR